MQDMSQNVYRPSESSFQGAASEGPQGFGRFDFSRAMSIGVEAYKPYIGLGVGTTIVWILLFLVAYVLTIALVGLFLMPVLAIGPTMLGLNMVRKRPEFSNLFRGFEAYGRVLGTAALLSIFALPVLLIMAGPFFGATIYMSLQNKGTASADPNMAALGLMGVSYLFMLVMVPVVYYLMGRMILVFPLVIERAYGPMQAIKTSWSVTAPYQWWLMLFAFTTQIVGQMGMYLCGFGMLFTMPLSHAFTGAAIYMLLGEDDGTLAPPKHANAPVQVQSTGGTTQNSADQNPY